MLAGLLVIGTQSVFPAQAAPSGNTKAFWAVQRSPNPSGNGGFSGVDCRSATACTAVGSYYDHATKHGLPLAASWNGRTWTVQPTQAPAQRGDSDLRGVSCAGRRFCVAVGRDMLTVDRWIALAEVWRGRRWEITRTPPVALPSLEAVSCSSATDCMAVGATGQLALVEHWDGTRWTIQRVPLPPGSVSSVLYGVSCVSRIWCMAAGFYGHEHYGDTYAFTEIWIGRHWSIIPAQQIPDAASQFLRVSCTSKASCTAVGTYNKSGYYPLAERWNGKIWAIQSAPHPKGQLDSTLLGVGCSTARACSAVGWYMTDRGHIYTFADSWNGKVWVLQATVNPSDDLNVLSSVACTSATACTAVGSYAGPESVTLSLIERYSACRAPSRRRDATGAGRPGRSPRSRAQRSRGSLAGA